MYDIIIIPHRYNINIPMELIVIHYVINMYGNILHIFIEWYKCIFSTTNLLLLGELTKINMFLKTISFIGLLFVFKAHSSKSNDDGSVTFDRLEDQIGKISE